MRPVINSVKHIVQLTPTLVAALAVGKITIAEGKALADIDTVLSASDVRAGAVIKAVYCELWIAGDGTEQSSSTWCFKKRSAGDGNMTFAEINAMQGFPGKNTILMSGQGIVPSQGQYPMAIFKGWIKVPKGKQRIALGDQLEIVVSSIADGIRMCGLFIFKEYY